MSIARPHLRLHSVMLSVLFLCAIPLALALPPAGAGSSDATSPSANTTPPPARPSTVTPLDGVYFPVLRTSNLASSTGLSDTAAGVAASRSGITGTGTINIPEIDVTKPWRAAILVTMGEAPGNTNALTVWLTNPSKPQNGFYIQLGGNASLGNTAAAGISYGASVTYGVLSSVPTGTRMWLSITSDGKGIWPCLIPDTPSTLGFTFGNYSHPWDGALYCAVEGAQYVSSTNGAQTLGISQIQIKSTSTLDVVNGVYVSEGNLDAPSDGAFFPPMYLNPDTGLDNNGNSYAPVNSSTGTLPYATRIFVPGSYGQPGGTPVVLAHHPYGNVAPPASAWPTMTALYNDGYMVAVPFAWANGGGDGNYINALTSNNGAPSGLLLRKTVVDWIRQNLPFSWQLYQFGTSMGCNNALEYEQWWPGSAAVLCVSGSTSFTVADSPPYGKGTISSADATALSGFYLALQPTKGQNPATGNADWKQISAAPAFVDDSYLQNPPYSYADAWSAAKSYTAGQIVSVPYSGTLQSLAPYDPSLNPETFLSVPIYMSTCQTDTTITAENRALYDAVQAVGGDITLKVVNDGTCSHQSADLFFPSTFVSFFDKYRKNSPSLQAGAGPLTGAPTATVLALTSAGSAASTVLSGSLVTLTAAVGAGSAPVTSGQVSFCDSGSSGCTDAHRVGTAQLTSAGTASLNLVPPIGSHTYTAIFAGTAAAASSSSAAVSLAVTGLFSTSTLLAASGSAGNYALTAAVTGAGPGIVPTGTVSFLDASDGNKVLGTATLGTATPVLNWTAAQTPATGDGPGSAVTADFNGDGKPDLAVANYQSNSVTILLGNGDGTFSPVPAVAAGAAPAALVAGDFNSDGKTDLALANFQSNSVAILFGNGDGTFTAGSTLATGKHPAALAMGDFNGDGNLDLAVANSGDNTVTVLLGNSDGTFTRSASVPATGSYPDSIAVGDFNGDGNLDLAVANRGSNSITVLRGNGDGTFTDAAIPLTGVQPVWVEAGDFNRDGAIDLAVANYGDSTVTVLLGIGDATFVGAPSLSVGSSPAYVAALDFNRDGNLDLAVAASGANSVTLLTGNGDGTFTPFGAAPATGNFSNSVAVADFDADGGPDLAITNFNDNTVTVLLSQVTTTVSASATGIAPLGSGTHRVQATYPGDANYSGSVSSETGLTAQQVTPVITWAAPVAIAYATPLSTAQLNASSTVSGIFSYAPAPGTVLPAGSHTLSVTFTPDDATHYTTATGTVSLTVNQTAPAITWAAPGAIPYGTALSAAQLNASSAASGTFAYTPAPGTVLPAGSHTLSVTFTPADVTDYTTATGTARLTVNQAAPAITWAAPGAIPYGAALSVAQLNASSAASGTFAYTPAVGTVLPAGPHTLSVTFTPADVTDYTTATATVDLVVNQAAPAISWAAPGAIPYGTALSVAQLNASSAASGTFAYTPAVGTVLPAGPHTLSVTFTPADVTDYTTATGTVTLTVNQATPAINWASPAAIPYGTALSGAQLNAGSTVAGTYAYAPAVGTVLPAGPHTLSVTFTPADVTDYTTATGTVTLTVNQATPAINWTSPAAIRYGAALSGAQLNASSTTPGIFNYSPAAGVVPGAGTQTLTVAFAPADTADYTTATAAVALTVNQAMQTITFAQLPSALTFGSAPVPLMATASSGLPVAFSVTGPTSLNGSTLAITGAGAITVTASQAGNPNYSAAQPVVETIEVSKATPSAVLTASSGSVIAGSLVTFTATVTGTGAIPTGTVTFFSGTTPAGTAALDGSGAATLEVNSLPLGVASITAAYGGDSNFNAATSPALPITVTAAVVDFSIAASPSSRSVLMGQAATFTVTVTPISGASLPVTLSCAQLPAGASCSFSPVTGDGSASSTLVVQTAAPNSGTTASLFSTGSKGVALAALLLFLLPMRISRLRKRWPAFFAMLALLAFGTSAINGCGGTYSIAAGTPAGVQAITVSATANNGTQAITHEAVLTLNILSPD